MLINFVGGGQESFCLGFSIICFGDKLFGIQSLFDFLLILSHIRVYTCFSFCSYAQVCAFEGLRPTLGIFLTHTLPVAFLLFCFCIF